MTYSLIRKAAPLERLKHLPLWVWTLAIALVIYATVYGMILNGHPDLAPRFRLSLNPLVIAPIIVKVHVGGALTAFFLGLVLLVSPKGIGLHKPLGWLWVVAMAVTAISSFFLTGFRGQSLSPIHALSAWVMLSLPFGIAAIRRGDVNSHRKTMTGMFLAGMAIAGLFSFLPGRLMWSLIFAA